MHVQYLWQVSIYAGEEPGHGGSEDEQVSSGRVEHRYRQIQDTGYRYRYARSCNNHVSRRGECVQSKGPEGISGQDVINMDMDVGEAWAGLCFGLGLDNLQAQQHEEEAGFIGYGVWESVCACRVPATGCKRGKLQRGCRTMYLHAGQSRRHGSHLSDVGH
jgi:hypothetical protein